MAVCTELSLVSFTQKHSVILSQGTGDKGAEKCLP